jgi:hypothetical protein
MLQPVNKLPQELLSSYRPVSTTGREYRQRKTSDSTDSRMSVLARVHHLSPGALDVDIQQPK